MFIHCIYGVMIIGFHVNASGGYRDLDGLPVRAATSCRLRNPVKQSVKRTGASTESTDGTGSGRLTRNGTVRKKQDIRARAPIERAVVVTGESRQPPAADRTTANHPGETWRHLRTFFKPKRISQWRNFHSLQERRSSVAILPRVITFYFHPLIVSFYCVCVCV